ncbi:Rft-1-domain-containing protein [Gonapodya prolifera JEL478]|uniref:Man(5)GlcNAc(2)-PP-dolichol translocation protein RFT1 n=1 Tax=Gonapodya prolifera (strain JEL478) TaxID=1344416 RepID=A0A139AIA3_GONPJ|nr:Rft-1-domain-containing protein [Gonapodya prolifera JEL478]|eukprot:KXS16153.1 Rft-1-domain-containing protein [Gonapodya prolifera JEL478]
MAPGPRSADRGASSNSLSDESILSRTLSGSVYLVLLQLLSRSLTFALNQVLLRLTGPDVLGIVSVQLDLLLATVCFLAREGVRMVALRGVGRESSDSSPDGKSPSSDYVSSLPALSRYTREQRQLLNLAFIPIPLGMVLTLLATTYYISNPPEAAPPSYTIACLLYAMAVTVELASEPFYVASASRLEFSIRAKIEGAAVLGKTVTVGAVFAVAWWMEDGVVEPGSAVAAFALGQLVYGAFLFGGYLSYWRSKRRAAMRRIGEGRASVEDKWLGSRGLWVFLPAKFVDGSNSYFFLASTIRITAASAIQSLVKLLLNEGDRILLTRLVSTSEQGVYAIALNYGSLIVRTLYLPLEDSLRSLFSASLGTHATPRLESLKLVSPILSTVVHLHTLLALPFVFLVPWYTSTLITTLAGPKWLLAAPVLSLYCCLLPLLALNGTSEAFLQSTAQPSSIRRYTIFLVAFWVMFAGTAKLLAVDAGLGARGVVLAGMLNSGLRLAYGVWYAREYFLRDQAGDGKEVTEWRIAAKSRLSHRVLFPYHIAVWGVWSLAAAVGWWSETHVLGNSLEQWRMRGYHVALGALVGTLATIVTGLFEKSFLSEVAGVLRKVKAQKVD